MMETCRSKWYQDVINSGKYVGGDLEIQNTVEEYMFRGRIKSAKITYENELLVVFDRFVKMKDGGWEKENMRPYAVNLLTVNVSDIGDDRIALNTGFVSNELCVFFTAEKSSMQWEKYE